MTSTVKALYNEGNGTIKLPEDSERDRNSTGKEGPVPESTERERSGKWKGGGEMKRLDFRPFSERFGIPEPRISDKDRKSNISRENGPCEGVPKPVEPSGFSSYPPRASPPCIRRASGCGRARRPCIAESSSRAGNGACRSASPSPPTA